MPETLPYINEIFVESSLHILNMAIFHCLTNQLIINKNEMSVQPHQTTSVKSPCSGPPRGHKILKSHKICSSVINL